MTVDKNALSLGTAAETEYGYVQAVRIKDTIYLSGQVSMDAAGKTVGVGDMEAQMRQAYANVELVLGWYGAAIENIVDETLDVTNMDAAFAARVKCRKDVFSGKPVLASTIVQIERLAFPDLMVEIKCVAAL
jgi:enamine deaminase RidA (YjgF/YER057c/UK114 family)